MTWQKTADRELAKPTHQNEPFCRKCAELLVGVDPELIQMVAYARSRDRSVHVSCGFRNERDQNQAFLDKRSKLRWPDSKHNRMVDGKPCAAAVDLFTIDADGNARFVMHQYELIWGAVKAFFSVEWGGNWKTFKDGPHFELRGPGFQLSDQSSTLLRDGVQHLT